MIYQHSKSLNFFVNKLYLSKTYIPLFRIIKLDSLVYIPLFRIIKLDSLV